MDLRLATAAVRWLVGHTLVRKKDTFDVHFFGGEPLLAFDVVEVVVHAARRMAAESGLAPHFEVCTNGLLTEAQTDFVGDHFHTVILSFDGPPELQDRNRPAKGRLRSYPVVARTARMLGESSAQLCLRVCVTGASVGRMAELAAWFGREFKPSAVSWEVLKPTPEAGKAGLVPPDPFAFAAAFVAARRVLAAQGIRSIYAADLTAEPRFTFCPVGRDALLLSPDGRVHACYLPEEAWQAQGMDLTIGRLGKDGRLRLDERSRRAVYRYARNKPFCDGCFCRWTCAGGCHVQMSPPGRDPRAGDFCVQTRIITACSLLEKMGESPLVDALLADREALETLARQPAYAVRGNG